MQLFVHCQDSIEDELKMKEFIDATNFIFERFDKNYDDRLT